LPQLAGRSTLHRVATSAAVLEAIEGARQARRQVPIVVRRLMRHFDVTDRHLAEAFGLSRQAINQRVNGKTPIRPEEEDGFAAFFGLPAEVLRLAADDALRWVLDHPDAGPASLSEGKPS